MSMPRKNGKQTNSEADPQGQPMNKTYPLNQAPRQDNQPRSNSYDADTLARDMDAPCQVLGHFIPPRQSHPADNNPSESEDDSSQNQNETTVFNGQTQQKTVSRGTGMDQPLNTRMQTSPAAPAPTGIAGTTQSSPRKRTQVGGTLTTPPTSPKKTTSSGGIQTTPPQNTHQDQGTQGQPDHNLADNDDQQAQDVNKDKGRGKKSKKKPSHNVAPHPVTCYGANIV